MIIKATRLQTSVSSVNKKPNLCLKIKIGTDTTNATIRMIWKPALAVERTEVISLWP